MFRRFVPIAMVVAMACGENSGRNADLDPTQQCDPDEDCARGEGGAGGAGGIGEGVGELVVCDQVETYENSRTTYYYEKAIIPDVEPWTAIFTFCDIYVTQNGEITNLSAVCNEGRVPNPGYYRDGDLHVVCYERATELDGSSQGAGAQRIYVRFDEAEPADRRACRAACEDCDEGYAQYCVEDCIDRHESGEIHATSFNCSHRKQVYLDVDTPSIECRSEGAECPAALSWEGQNLLWKVEYGQGRLPARVEVGGAVTFDAHASVHQESRWVLVDVTEGATLGYRSADIPLGQYDQTTGDGVIYSFIAIYWD